MRYSDLLVRPVVKMKLDDLLEKLEQYRKKNGLSKAELARAIGANEPQQYRNWVARGSLPKKYYDQALRIMGQSGALTKDQAEFFERYESLSKEDREVIDRMIDSFLKSS